MTTVANDEKKYPWLAKYPKGIEWGAPIGVDTVFSLIDTAASKFPDKFCIDFLGKKYTYGQAGDLVNRVAKGLQSLGVKKGVKVGLFMPNAPHFVFFYFGILKAGGTVVNYSPLYAEREVRNQIEDSETDIMVTLDLALLYNKISPMLEKTRLQKMIICPLTGALPFPKNILFPLLKAKEVAKVTWDERHIGFDQLIENDGMPASVSIDPMEDIALLQYTGGTTGVPKGAMLTHANVYGNACQAELWFQGIEYGREKILAALPLFHVFAMTAIMTLAMKTGSEIVMMFPRYDTNDAMKLIQKHKITFFPAVPTIYNMIANHPKVKDFDLSTLKTCLSGGAALPAEVKRNFEALTGCHLVEAYGLSETSPAATSNPINGINKENSIGMPFPGTTIRIMSREHPDQEVPLGEKGEICIEGPQVMKGYWKRPDETKSVLRGTLFHTGDVGYMDEDGYTFLVDRIKDLILCNGYNVYPRVVEEAIYLHPAVMETTVIGVHDAVKGEVPKAFVKLGEGQKITEEDLKTFLKDKLSPLEVPKYIEFRDELPKTVIGKLSKKELVAEEAAKEEEGQH
jgi:long-chain acyl-CoA synthetase